MKPILFNTEMVRAILDGRKTVTRRAIKPKYDVLIKIDDGDVFYADCFGKWCPVAGNPELAEQRLYGRDRRTYLLSNEICRIWPKGIYGLVSAKRTSGENGISFDFRMSSEQEKDIICSQSYLRGISRKASGLCSSSPHGREPIKQCPVEFEMGNCSRELERQETASHCNSWRKTSNVQTDGWAKSGNLELITSRNESEEDSECLLCESNCNLENIKVPFSVGQTLYVRETYSKDVGRYMYKANYIDNEKFYRDGKEVSIKWHPSIHMPKEAARIFLRVQDVHVERVQEITGAECVREGIPQESLKEVGEAFTVGQFADLWDSTVKPADLHCYGWDANPWVWVIDFERISRDEALKEESK